MKVIIQIPAFNEEASVAATIRDLPRCLPGVDRIEILVVDDGSTDRTALVARQAGADHIVRHRRNRGLARALVTGLEASLRLGADIIVNTDADNQYRGDAVAQLVRPILEERADIVVGDRDPGRLSHFSLPKRILQRVGSATVRWLSGTDVPDAVCGFRAFSRQAAQRMNVVSSFSYTVETLIQSGMDRLAVVSVPVAVNPPTRPSRLSRSITFFLLQSAATAVRTYTMYRPLRVFGTVSLTLFAAGSALLLRELYLSLRGADGDGGLVLGSSVLASGFFALLIGIMADLVAVNRALLESLLRRSRSSDDRPRAEDAGRE